MQIVTLSVRTTAAKRQDFNRIVKKLNITQTGLFEHMLRSYQEQVKVR